MRISGNYVLQKVVDEYIVVPVGKEAEKLKGVITLNETGAFLWDRLSKKDNTSDELIDALLSEFSVSKEQAQHDVERYVANLEQIGCLETK